MRHLTYFGLLDALEEKGCPVCSLLEKSMHKFMDALLYEHINEPGMRKEIRESLGFCNFHSWQLQKFGDGLGLSIIYKDLLNVVASRMKKISKSSKSIKNFLKEFLKGSKESYHQKMKRACLICKGRKEAEARYISTFLVNFHEPEFYDSFKDSFGLCLPHLIAAIKRCKEEKMVKELLSIESEKIDSLIQELKEFQRKQDYRFSKEGFGREKDSWKRAIEKMIGRKGII